MNILAIDLGKFNSMFCFFDSTSQCAEFLQAATVWGYFLSALLHRLAAEPFRSTQRRLAAARKSPKYCDTTGAR